MQCHKWNIICKCVFRCDHFAISHKLLIGYHKNYLSYTTSVKSDSSCLTFVEASLALKRLIFARQMLHSAKALGEIN